VTDADLAAVLRIARTVAVVGLSPHAHRPSHGVARYLQRAGYRIVPVNPGHDTILGERSYATLGEAAAAHTIDIVDVFRRSEFAGAVVDQALPLRPRLVFLQLGVTDVAAGEGARAAGVPFIQDRCLAVEHQRLVN
jgi:predicted CoA-binding protein